MALNYMEDNNAKNNNDTLLDILQCIEENDETQFINNITSTDFYSINGCKTVINDYCKTYDRIALEQLFKIYISKAINLNSDMMNTVLDNIKNNNILAKTSLKIFAKCKNEQNKCCICLEKFTMFTSVSTTTCDHIDVKNVLIHGYMKM